MGQYHKVCNLDKSELLHPHQFGDGLKLMEFGMSGAGTLTALAAMLVKDVEHTGRWAGNRLTVTGDYGDEGQFVPAEHAAVNLYTYASEDDNGNTPYRKLLDEPLAALAALGIRTKIRTDRSDREPDPDFPLFDSRRKFDQPEDLCLALEAFPQEDLNTTLEEVNRCLRMASIPSDVAWHSVESAHLRIDEQTGLATSLTVEWVNRHKHRDVPPYVVRTLGFPATAAKVRQFFGIKMPRRPRQLTAERKLLAAS